MVAGSFSEEYVSPFPVSRLWKAGVLDLHNLLPKIVPEMITSVVILQGDGGVGTIKQYNFGPANTESSYVKDRTDVLDNEKHLYKYTVIEGGLVGLKLKSYSFDFQCVPTSDGATKSKVKVEYETLDDADLTEADVGKIKGYLKAVNVATEAYLKANPTAYA